MPGHDLSPGDLERVAIRERKGHGDEGGSGAASRWIAQHPALLHRGRAVSAEAQGRRLDERRAHYRLHEAEDGQVSRVQEDHAWWQGRLLRVVVGVLCGVPMAGVSDELCTPRVSPVKHCVIALVWTDDNKGWPL